MPAGPKTPGRFEKGETVLIPAGMRHEFFVEEGEGGAFVILMYGEGA